MSNSSLISKSYYSPHRTVNRNHVIDTITIHCYVAQASIESMGAWFTTPSAKCSCNYGIGSDGRIALIVDEKDRSWCTSSSANDHRAITIECASDKVYPYKVNDAVMASLIKLLVDICKRNDIKELKWKNDKNLIGQVDKQNMTVHRWFANKECPGQYLLERHSDIANKVNKILGSMTVNTATNDEATQEPHWYRVRLAWNKPDSQLGAYETYENAKANCPTGYSVFDENGKCLYTEEKLGTVASDFNGLTEKQAAEKILEMVRANAESTGILASVTAAQMILESGYVSTELAKKANNCFGMKTELSGNTWSGSAWDGKSFVTINTKEEYTKGNVVTISAKFRSYKYIEDSIADHSAYLLSAMNGSKKRYEGIDKCTDYRKCIQLIKDGGYATDSKYVEKICNIIARFGLDKYDKKEVAKKEETKPVNKAEEIKDKIVEKVVEKVTETKKPVEQSVSKDFMVKVKVPTLTIRKGPGTNYAAMGYITTMGTYTIIDTSKDGKWGLLLSYEKNRNGWICIDSKYVTRK